MFVFNSVQVHVNHPVELWMLLADLTLHIMTVIVECTAIACTVWHATMLTTIGVRQYEPSPHRRQWNFVLYLSVFLAFSL